MIRISNSNFQTKAGSFHGHIEVDTRDGDANSKHLLEFLEKIIEKAIRGSIVINFDDGPPPRPTTPIDLAEAILAALDQDDPNAFLGEFDIGSRTTVDGEFELMMVAERILKKLREPEFLNRYEKAAQASNLSANLSAPHEPKP
jgi:hypothetical protein